ncbi:MAG: ferrochelatase [Polyangiales bacterium]
MPTPPYDAVLLLSFGGPEKPEDVMPFLRNVVRGRPVPEARLEAVAEHYMHFGGKSPIGDQNRALLAALERHLRAHGPDLPVYWGNRHWHPLLPDALRQIQADGRRRVLAFVTSAFGSDASCRQYLAAIAAARQALGPEAPEVDKIRLFFNHPDFIAAQVAQVQDALAAHGWPPGADYHLSFTAHSIPTAMAEHAGYVAQLEQSAALVADVLTPQDWSLVYQSRSGPPTQPWLEPDIGAHLQALAAQGVARVVVVPLGFVSDHMEVRWDLDIEAKEEAAGLGLDFVRAGTVGTHPRFVQMIAKLIAERTAGAPRQHVGQLPPAPDRCVPGCCAWRPAAAAGRAIC